MAGSVDKLYYAAYLQTMLKVLRGIHRIPLCAQVL